MPVDISLADPTYLAKPGQRFFTLAPIEHKPRVLSSKAKHKPEITPEPTHEKEEYDPGKLYCEWCGKEVKAGQFQVEVELEPWWRASLKERWHMQCRIDFVRHHRQKGILRRLFNFLF